jgi:hypothetical protein
MLKVLVILILVAIAAGAAFVGIYTNQPDLTFRTFGQEISYPTSQGNLFVLFDNHGRIVFRSLSKEDSLDSLNSDNSKTTIRWENDGDKQIKWIETATTRRKIVFNKDKIQIFDKTWPKAQGSDTDSGNPVVENTSGTDIAQTGDGTVSVEDDDTDSSDSGAENITDGTSSQSSYPAGFDPFAPENMMLIKTHPSGDKVVEWYETLEKDFKVKVVKMNGYVVYKKKFPVQVKETAPETLKDTGEANVTDATVSPEATKAPVPTESVVAIQRPTEKPVKPVDPNLQPKPSGQTFKLISQSSSGSGRSKKYVLWYESADWKRKVIKEGGKEVMSFNYPKTPPPPTVAPVPTVAAVPTVVPVATVAAVPTVIPAATVAAVPTVVPAATVAAVPTVVPAATVAAVPTVIPAATVAAVPTVVPVATESAETVIDSSSSTTMTSATTGLPVPAVATELVEPLIQKMSVQWTETETASFKTLVDGDGRVIFRQRMPK